MGRSLVLFLVALVAAFLLSSPCSSGQEGDKELEAISRACAGECEQYEGGAHLQCVKDCSVQFKKGQEERQAGLKERERQVRCREEATQRRDFSEEELEHCYGQNDACECFKKIRQNRSP